MATDAIRRLLRLYINAQASPSPLFPTLTLVPTQYDPAVYTQPENCRRIYNFGMEDGGGRVTAFPNL